jgi:hypothetical protein
MPGVSLVESGRELRSEILKVIVHSSSATVKLVKLQFPALRLSYCRGMPECQRILAVSQGTESFESRMTVWCWKSK